MSILALTALTGVRAVPMISNRLPNTRALVRSEFTGGIVPATREDTTPVIFSNLLA
ncbi:hypothetical protein PF008_g17210 [Phytophthora fragariae]|uniref:Uncharacterized protein n=1 Tax=Phytophthora fragariae TaxID=53985 RepID=A0A6G0R9E3_9STRA|nr:hypothetical protein PF008_g17210 [Phytophthora fragariae]